MDMQYNFKSKTKKVIEDLRQILISRNGTAYKTKGEFYREIELLKFPYLKLRKYANEQKINEYSQQQYDTILYYCRDMGWISVTPKNNLAYIVNVHSDIAFSNPTKF